MKLVRIGCVCLGLAFAGCSGPQPHMHAALDELREARHELEAAEADKGGHRAKAIEACDRAIEETRLGIEFAATHH